MAQADVDIKVKIQAEGAQKTVGGIRAELKEANKELIKAQNEFGEYSQEAIKAARRVAELRDRVQEAGETAALFDPGKKFQAFSGALQSVAGGFAAVQGALGLVGVESEDLQKQLLKVQSALALSQGLSTIADSAKDFRRLVVVLKEIGPIQKVNAAANTLAAATMRAFGIATNTTTIAFRALRAAIIATGIGALVVGISLLIEKIVSWTSSTDDAEAAQKRLNEQLEAQKDLLDSNLKVIDDATKAQIALAKKRGASEQELRGIEKKANEERLAELSANLKRAEEVQDRIRSDRKATDEQNDAANKAVLEAQRKYWDERTRQTQAALDQDADASQKNRDKEQQRREQAEEKRRKDTEDANKLLQQLRDEAADAAIANETDRALEQQKRDEGREIARIKKLQLNKELEQSLITAIEEKGERDRAAIRKKAEDDAIIARNVFVDAIKVAIEKGAELKKKADEDAANAAQANLQLALEIQKNNADTLEKQRQAQIDSVNAEFNLRVSKAKETGENIALLEELRAQRIAKINEDITEKEKTQNNLRVQNATLAADAISNTLGDVSKLVGEQTALGKALAIAQAVIDTATSAIRAYQSTVGIPVVGPVLAPIAAATAVAFGVKNINTIRQTKIPGGRDVGGPSANFGSAAAAPIAIPRPEAAVTALDRQTINQLGSNTTRAYVVESDITNSQERITRINRAARLG